MPRPASNDFACSRRAAHDRSRGGSPVLSRICRDAQRCRAGMPAGVDPASARATFYPLLDWPHAGREVDRTRSKPNGVARRRRMLTPRAVHRLHPLRPAEHGASRTSALSNASGSNDICRRRAGSVRSAARRGAAASQRGLLRHAGLPGRRSGGRRRIGRRPAMSIDQRRGASMLVGSQRLMAAAWADRRLRPSTTMAVVPGGDHQQGRMAFRFG